MPPEPESTRGRTIAHYVGNSVLIVLGTAAAVVVLYFVVVLGTLILGVLAGLVLARMAARMLFTMR